jgi:hypothetical protein
MPPPPRITSFESGSSTQANDSRGEKLSRFCARKFCQS